MHNSHVAVSAELNLALVGPESLFIDFDAELAALLSRAQLVYQAVPGGGMTGGTMASIRCGPGSA